MGKSIAVRILFRLSCNVMIETLTCSTEVHPLQTANTIQAITHFSTTCFRRWTIAVSFQRYPSPIEPTKDYRIQKTLKTHTKLLYDVYFSYTTLCTGDRFGATIIANRNRNPLEQQLQTSPATAPHFGVALRMKLEDEQKQHFTSSPMSSEKDRTDTWSRNSPSQMLPMQLIHV